MLRLTNGCQDPRLPAKSVEVPISYVHPPLLSASVALAGCWALGAVPSCGGIVSRSNSWDNLGLPGWGVFEPSHGVTRGVCSHRLIRIFVAIILSEAALNRADLEMEP